MSKFMLTKQDIVDLGFTVVEDNSDSMTIDIRFELVSDIRYKLDYVSWYVGGVPFREEDMLEFRSVRIMREGEDCLFRGEILTKEELLETLYKCRVLDRPLGEVEEGRKHDDSKLRYDLLPVHAIEGVADVMTYGVEKYGPNNWQNVRPADRYYAAAQRHLAEIRKGNKIDPESGKYHLDHAITSLMMYREVLYNINK